MKIQSRNELALKHNDPAIWGGCIPAFCRYGTNFIECWHDLGISLIEAANLSPVTKFVAITGAVSRYKLEQSQKLVKVQDFN